MKLSALVPVLVAVVALGACAGTPTRTAAIGPGMTADGQIVRCREILVIGSNQLTTACGTEAQWEKYDRKLAWSAQALTLRLQGSSLSGGY